MRRVRTNDESGNNFNRHFREQLRNSEVEPSANLWDKINYKLDGEREKIKYDHWYYALLILLIPLAIANIYTNYDLEDYYSSLMDKSPSGHNSVAANNTPESIENLLPFKNNCAYSDNEEGELNCYGDNDRQSIAYASSSADRVSTTWKDLQRDGDDFFNTATASIGDGLTRTEIEGLDKKFSSADIPLGIDDRQRLFADPRDVVKGFHFGVDFGAHVNYFVFRQHALRPLISGDVSLQPFHGTQFGVSLGYNFSHRFGMEIEGIFRSTQGIKYQESRFNNKLVINGEVDLDYMHFPVLFKYKWSRISSRSYNPKVLNVLAGIQYSRLKSVNYTSDGYDYEIPENIFNQNELGLTLGLEYDLFLHRNYYISLGARGTFLADAGSYFNSTQSTTYNYLIGLNASLNYQVSRKHRNR